MEMTMVKHVIPTFYTPFDYTVEEAKALGNFEWRKFFAKEYMKIGFPKWKRLGLSKIPFGELKPYEKKFLSGNAGTIKKMSDAIKDVSGILASAEFEGAHRKFTLMSRAFFNTGFFCEVEKHGDVYANYEIDENSALIDESMVIVKSKSEATVIRKVAGNGNLRVSTTKFLVEKGAKLRFFNILIAPDISLSVDSNLYVVREGAEVEVHDILLGGEKVVSNHEFQLVEPGAKAKLTSSYFESVRERADLEYKLVHAAPETVGQLKGNGVVSDESYVIFRGNIDIPQESHGVTSEEFSYTLNLSPNARVDAIPTLNVRNKNVNASHAVTIGNLDENKTYYLMSRGLDEQTVKRIVTEGMFKPIIKEIPIKSVERDVKNGLFSRLSH